MEIISRLMVTLCTSLTLDGGLILGLGLLFVGFIINFILSVSCREYVGKKRAWLPVSAGMILCFVAIFSEVLDGGKWISYIYCFFAIPSVYFSYLFKKNKKKISDEHIELAKLLDKKAEQDAEFIDGEILSKRLPREVPKKTVCVNNLDGNPFAEKDGVNNGELNKITPSKIKEMFEEKNKQQFDLDFSHVKNVLNRLDYFSLSPADRRQVKELEISLAQAEGGEYSSALKERINDGLGALLKIMSKHGV